MLLHLLLIAQFCYNKWVRQFHAENAVVLSEYFLGLGINAFMDDKIGQREVVCMVLLPHGNGTCMTLQAFSQ